MLQNFDKNWTDAGNRNFVNYSNLPGGNYIFKVRASNSKGNWSKEISSLKLLSFHHSGKKDGSFFYVQLLLLQQFICFIATG